jgi:hypothetical protein
VEQINKVGHMRLLAIIFIIFCSFDSMAQYDWDSKNWDKKSLGFGCGFSGQMTKPVSQISKTIIKFRLNILPISIDICVGEVKRQWGLKTN